MGTDFWPPLYIKLGEIPPATTLGHDQFQLANGVETSRFLAGSYKKDDKE